MLCLRKFVMGKIETRCAVCGRIVYRWPFQIRNFTPMCSAECRRKARLGNTPGNVLSLEGMRFGSLTALEIVGSKDGNKLWKCVCDCGSERIVPAGYLNAGLITSCGRHPWKSGKAHPNWRKGETITPDGYREIPFSGHKGNHRYRSEHRALVERAIGRELSKHEVVHHINEDKLDNRLENLAVLTRSEHALLHAAMRKGVVSDVHVTPVSERRGQGRVRPPSG